MRLWKHRAMIVFPRTLGEERYSRRDASGDNFRSRLKVSTGPDMDSGSPGGTSMRLLGDLTATWRYNIMSPATGRIYPPHLFCKRTLSASSFFLSHKRHIIQHGYQTTLRDHNYPNLRRGASGRKAHGRQPFQGDRSRAPGRHRRARQCCRHRT